MLPLLAQRSNQGLNHGKKSRKFNPDCTICHSCRFPRSDSIVSLWPEKRYRLAGIPVRLTSVITHNARDPSRPSAVRLDEQFQPQASA